MNKTDFANAMAEAQLAYGNKLSEETYEIYWQNLQHADGEQVLGLLRKHIEEERFFPRISDLKPPPDKRPQLGPKYLEPPKLSPAMMQANRIMLSAIIKSGGVAPGTLKAWQECKNAVVEDAEAAGWGETELHDELTRLLGGLLEGHEGRTL